MTDYHGQDRRRGEQHGDRRSYQVPWYKTDRRKVASGALMGLVMTLIPGASDKAEASRAVRVDAGGTEPPTRGPRRGAPASLRNASLYVAPDTPARRAAESLRNERPGEAALLEDIASQPVGHWFGDWNRDVRGDVKRVVASAAGEGALPVLVAYNIPNRDCNQYSAGGVGSAEEYRGWLKEFAAGIGDGAALVVLEPDGLALLSCLTPEKRDERFSLIEEAVQLLKSLPNTLVYVDAGHADWVEAEEMASRLHLAGVQRADGFSLNVSNFVETAKNAAYGDRVGSRLGGAHYVIDTSRNGAGPDPSGEWCNPPGAALGPRPTTATGHDMADAFLWVKPPGESDGECNGGPPAGQWWQDYALSLAAGGRLTA